MTFTSESSFSDIEEQRGLTKRIRRPYNASERYCFFTGYVGEIAVRSME